MGCCKKPRKKGPPPLFSLICAAFGLGVFLALLCSLKLVMALAAVFLRRAYLRVIRPLRELDYRF